MGNIGRSSTGCGLCRKRKIKCDEGKPGCKRCAQIRKPCPGYPYQVQLEVRQIGGAAPGHHAAILPVPGPSVSPTQNVLFSKVEADDTFYLQPDKVKAESTAESVALHKLPPYHRSISPPPRYDLHHQSLCFFLNLFCYQANRLYAFPVLDFLPGMLERSSPHSSLSQAANAVSRMTLADRYSGKDVRLQTGKEYGYALKLTKATIRDKTASIQDETVIAVWLLGLYELISVILSHGRASIGSLTADEEWQSHILHVRGAMNLLQLRGMTQFDNPVSEKVFRILKAAIQLRLFILTSVTGKDFDDLEIDVYQEEHEFVPSPTANKATRYFHRVARLLEQTRVFLLSRYEFSSKAKGYKAHAKELLQYGEALDSGMTDWCKEEPAWDMMKIRTGTSGTMWAFYPSHALYYFYSFWIFLYHLRFLTARVKLYEGLIELAKLDLDTTASDRRRSLSASAALQISAYRKVIQDTAADLIGLTAYALGDVTPAGEFNSSARSRHPGSGIQEINVIATMQLVIPLKMLQRSEYPTAVQKGAVDLAISHIGDGFRRQPVGIR